MAENKQVPTWQDYMGQMPTKNINAPYAPGTKTMDHLQMDSANRRHAAEMALGRDRLALQKWEAQMRFNLDMMEFEALKAARAEEASLKRDYYGLDRDKWEWEKDMYNQQAPGGGSPALSGGYSGGTTPGQAVSDFSVRDVSEAVPKEQRMRYAPQSPALEGR